MKTVAIKTLVSAIALFLMLPVMAQKGVEDGSKYGHGQDSINCLMNLSLYKEFFKHNNYRDAIGPWRKVFAECPASSQNMYIDGVKMYKNFIRKENNPEKVEELVDTIMLIYDRRMEYFQDEANVLGRKATDLLRYRKDDINSIQEAYGYLKESMELGKDKSRDAVVILFVNTSVTLTSAGVHENNVAIDDYFTATEIIDKRLASRPNDRRWTRAKETVDNFVLDGGILDCASLNNYYEPIFEANQNDEAFLQKIIMFYEGAGCDRADMYARASEKMYEINPSHESAYQVARLFVAKQQYDKAIQYYKEATSAEADNETKATYFYELALVTNVEKNYCQAIEYAREAIKLNPNYGEAYMLLGDSFIASRNGVEDNLNGSTAFWAAVDKFRKAKEVSPELAEEADKKIADYSGLYPNSEDCFFLNLEEGKSYLVKGCINEYTVIKYRK